MPSAPTFDYYAALEVESTATSQELTASYRRLARIHHPDKNPDNAEAATVIFQKIQLAYETLIDPAERSQYDARASSATSTSFSPESQEQSTPFYSAYESNEDGDGDLDEFIFVWGSPRRGYSFFRNRAPESNESYEGMASSRRTTEAETARESSRRAAELREERLAREANEARIKAARAAAKQAEEDAKLKEKDALRSAEKSKQEARWVAMKASTKDEKLETCLHSEFCTKIQQRQKFKCGACKVKRGITAFECPYCSMFICQQCVGDFTKKRIAAEKNPNPKPEPVAKPEPEPKVDGNDEKPTAANFKGKGRAKNGMPASPRCYNCHKEGHIARNCRNRAGAQPNGTTGMGAKKNVNSNTKASGNGQGQGQGKGKGKGQ
ncbi:DnaJ-domain-containing protein [Hypoxylon sp. FL1857]|nr:DnaJ-domain-containing protein [Hypoxylon sp. FL1857]